MNRLATPQPRNPAALPLRILNAIAPTRICDNGGWTDTWFAEYGSIFNIAVSPYCEVQLCVFPRSDDRPRIVINAENYGDRYSRELGQPWQKHPLIEATLEMLPPPSDIALEISLFSTMPPGASTGTSAAITVALLGALDRLTEGQLSKAEIALLAQQVETVKLGGQCGVQDQLAAAYGGISLIDMHAYPQATVQTLQLSPTILLELEQRLSLIYLGVSHSSTAVHEKVIRHLEDSGPQAREIEALRQTAKPAADALERGDIVGFGRTLIQNTEYQRDLHPALISPAAQSIIDIAQAHGALGWKVNGAGGDGGSVAILGAARADVRRSMLREILAESALFAKIPVTLSPRGLTVWESKRERT